MSTDNENDVFSPSAIAHLLSPSRWRKSIGLDNLPIDAFKSAGGPSSLHLSVLFKACWAHQTVPSAWGAAFMVPIPKGSTDVREPGNWRGIALQSHFKKLFETSVRSYMSAKGWLKTHQLQTGFQSNIGAFY